MASFRVMLCANSDSCPYTEQEFREFFGDQNYLEHWRHAIPVIVTLPAGRNATRMDWTYRSAAEVALQEQRRRALEDRAAAQRRYLEERRRDLTVLALSGKVLCSFRRLLPYHVDVNMFHPKLGLHFAQVVDHTSSMTTPFSDFVFTTETTAVSVVFSAAVPRNIWAKGARNGWLMRGTRGWRRSYKEFQYFSESAYDTDQMTVPTVTSQTFSRLVLQAHADEVRENSVEEGGKLPSKGRSWRGVYHAICLRSSLKLPSVIELVEQWKGENSELLRTITAEIEAKPFHTYFA